MNFGPTPFDEQTWKEWNNTGFANATIGWEFMPSEKTGIDLSAGYYWMFNDNIDQVNQGRYNDFYWTFKLAINFYLGK